MVPNEKRSRCILCQRLFDRINKDLENLRMTKIKDVVDWRVCKEFVENFNCL